VSRGRFALLTTLLAMAVGAASFAAGVQVFDDDGPDDPPGRDAAGDADGTSTTAPAQTTTSAPPTDLETPTLVVVVSSESDEAAARGIADELAARGYPAGVLHSDDYTSLNPGLWVAYTGPYADGDEAGAALDDLNGDGYTAAYLRCVGTADECSPDEDDDD